MERIVYLLGAGFTAPLGLPVMKDFLPKSRALYASHPAECAFFGDVFKQIEWLGKIKRYYNSELMDIEEILEIFEMSSPLSVRRKQQFAEYIRTVIALSTPVLDVGAHDPEEVLDDSWPKHIFNPGDPLSPYAYFLLSIQNMIVRPEYFFTLDRLRKHLSFRRNDTPRAAYGIITVNYDLVLEHICAFIREHMTVGSTFQFFRTTPGDDHSNTPPFARLHGGIAGEILPPSWNAPHSPAIRDAWLLAGEMLRDATQVRIIGCSLSGGDSPLKDMLVTSMEESSRLERVDVLCRDDDLGTVARRYGELPGEADLTFINADVAEYLRRIYEVHAEGRLRRRNDLHFDRLEPAHARYFGR